MINFAGFGSGFREQSELRRRQRKELAEAFETFKANNPYATFDEYQAFIDQTAGDGLGSNYLRGGAPGEDVLKALAEENKKRKQADDARQALSDLQKRQQTLDMVQGSADAFLMNMDGDDFDGAYENFMSSYGDGAEQMFNGMNVRNFFTPKYRDSLIGDRLIDLTPRITQYVNATGGKVKDVAAFARYLNIPESQVQPFVDLAAQQHDQSVARWKMQNNDAVLSLVQREIDAGRDPNKVVETYLSGTGVTIDDLDMDYYTTEATRKRELEDEARERQEDEARVAATAQVESAFRTDPAIQAAMRRGDEQKVTELMLARAKRYLTNEQFKSVYGVDKTQATPTLFNEVFTSEAAEAVSGQIDAQGQRRDKATQAALATQQSAKKENVDSTFTYFENVFDKPQAALAAELAGVYYIDNSFRAALTGAFSSIPEELRESGDVAAIRQFVFAHPDVISAMQSGRKIDDYAKQRFDVTVNQLGGFNVESYDQYHVRTNDEIVTGFREIGEDVARADNIEDLNQRLAYLQAVERSLGGFVQDANTRIGLRKDRADRWVEYGTGGWDASRGNELVQGIATQSNAIRGTIANKIAETQAQLQQQPDPSVQASTALSTTQSPAGRATSEHSQNVNAVQDISEAAGFALQNQTTANPFAGVYDLAASPFRLAAREYNETFNLPEAEVARREGMREFLLSQDSATISIYASLPADAKQQMLADIKSLTPQAFEQKYKPLFEQYEAGDIRRVESLVPFSN